MKRISAIFIAALLLAVLAFGCGKDPAAVQLPDPDGESSWTVPTTIETESQSETETESITGPDEPQAGTTAKAATTTKTPTLSGSASTSKTTTTKPSTSSNSTSSSASSKTTTTTKPTTTQKGTTKYYPNGISISSKDDALSKFNAAVKRTLDSKAGFSKSHMITYKDWAFDPALLSGIPNMGGLIDPNAYVSDALNTALGKGVHSATVHKGDGTNLLRSNSFSMGDLKDVTYSGTQGGEWTVTLLVNDGQTRQEKRLFGSGISGNSPIDKGPLHMATGDGNLYDHMSADRVFSLVKNGLNFINADPIDISESTSQVKFVARIDGEGKLVWLQATYNQTINLTEIRILNGMDTYRNNTGSSTVTVTFDGFNY